MVDRPAVLEGKTYEIRTGCGNSFITVSMLNSKPFELIARLGKGGGCASSQCEALGRVISEALQAGVPVEKLTKHLIGIQCHVPHGTDENAVTSCADAIGKVLKKYED